jgi:hypothetical protein
MMWAAIPIFQRSEGGEPLAGPSGQTQYAGGAVQLDSALIRYLEANQGNAQILVAATGVDIDKLILATNKALMPLDGFSNYPLTTTELASLISQGKLRFLLIGQPQAIDPTQASSQQENIQAPAQQGSEQGPQTASNSGFNGASAPTGLNDVISWTTQHCQKVPSSQWQTSSTSEASRSSNPPQLYDCAAAH